MVSTELLSAGLQANCALLLQNGSLQRGVESGKSIHRLSRWVLRLGPNGPQPELSSIPEADHALGVGSSQCSLTSQNELLHQLGRKSIVVHVFDKDHRTSNRRQSRIVLDILQTAALSLRGSSGSQKCQGQKSKALGLTASRHHPHHHGERGRQRPHRIRWRGCDRRVGRLLDVGPPVADPLMPLPSAIHLASTISCRSCSPLARRAELRTEENWFTRGAGYTIRASSRTHASQAREVHLGT
mmetsp:Transcript_17510/g.40212  ORF Transcript_17510/g.40212 Transcript_17510/m.40212 type:complete len:242 (+) Transcript_17510:3428-4153(+)